MEAGSSFIPGTFECEHETGPGKGSAKKSTIGMSSGRTAKGEIRCNARNCPALTICSYLEQHCLTPLNHATEISSALSPDAV